MDARYCSAFTVFLIALFISGAAAQGAPEIKVTRTWGDLLSTQPVSVVSLPSVSYQTYEPSSQKPDPASVWVGIDRNHVAAYGGVLLYCLAKSSDFTPRLLLERNIGPLSIQVKWPGQGGDSLYPAIFNPKTGGFYKSPPFKDNTGCLLFMRSIPLGPPGIYFVRLMQPVLDTPGAKGIMLSETEVTATGSPSDPWTPWGERWTESFTGPTVDNAQGWPETTDSSGWRPNTVCNPAGGIAIPEVLAKPVVFSAIPGSSTPLPHLLPDSADPAIHISLDGNLLTVSLNQKQTVWSYPQDSFLTRWWINDKPWVPDPIFSEVFSRSEATVGARLSTIQMRIAFLPSRLHVEKGDKIGLQLLYTPGSWCNARFHGNIEKITETDSDAEPSIPSITFISNRIDFKYSGDPQNMAEK